MTTFMSNYRMKVIFYRILFIIESYQAGHSRRKRDFDIQAFLDFLEPNDHFAARMRDDPRDGF